MQAANPLIEKLKIFEDEIEGAQTRSRNAIRAVSGNVVSVPRLAGGCTSVWAQYTIRLPKGLRSRRFLAAALKAQGIPTAIYYPKSMHQQTAYRDFPGRRWRLAGERKPVLRRPSACRWHAYLDEPTQARIIKAVRGAIGA